MLKSWLNWDGDDGDWVARPWYSMEVLKYPRALFIIECTEGHHVGGGLPHAHWSTKGRATHASRDRPGQAGSLSYVVPLARFVVSPWGHSE